MWTDSSLFITYCGYSSHLQSYNDGDNAGLCNLYEFRMLMSLLPNVSSVIRYWFSGKGQNLSIGFDFERINNHWQRTKYYFWTSSVWKVKKRLDSKNVRVKFCIENLPLMETDRMYCRRCCQPHRLIQLLIFSNLYRNFHYSIFFIHMR